MGSSQAVQHLYSDYNKRKETQENARLKKNISQFSAQF